MAEKGAEQLVRATRAQKRDAHELADLTLPVGTYSTHGSPVAMETPLSRLEPTRSLQSSVPSIVSASMQFKSSATMIRLAVQEKASQRLLSTRMKLLGLTCAQEVR